MKVFISHSSKEKWAARRISDDVKELGADTFLDEKDIESGEPIDESIHEHLKDADHFLLLLSPSSLTSHWVLIELGGAIALGKHIVPILFYLGANDIPQPIRRFLARDINDIDKYYNELKLTLAGKPDEIKKRAPTVHRKAKPELAKLTFKPGDKVYVQVSPNPTQRDELGWNSDMDVLCGTTVTVKEIADEFPRTVKIEEDDGLWWWAYEWLEHVREE